MIAGQAGATAVCPLFCTMEKVQVIHPFPPVADGECRWLVLGSFPSVKSRENAFYYGHPQNRFWRVLAAVCGEAVPCTVEEKTVFLLGHHIALWDVIQSCEIVGSADTSIRNAVPNDLPGLLANCPVQRILLNGKAAERIYLKYWQGLPVSHETMPSTSPANAAWSLERLTEVWKKRLEW